LFIYDLYRDAISTLLFGCSDTSKDMYLYFFDYSFVYNFFLEFLLDLFTLVLNVAGLKDVPMGLW